MSSIPGLIRILAVDDHALLRKGLAATICFRKTRQWSPSEKLKLANQSLIWCSSAPGPMP